MSRVYPILAAHLVVAELLLLGTVGAMVLPAVVMFLVVIRHRVLTP